MMKSDIKKILIPRFDTMGDIVLFSGVLEALLEEYPGAELTVMVLDKVKQISTILNPNIRWRPIPPEVHYGTIEPLYSGALDYQALIPIIDEVKRARYDLVISPLFSQTFLGSYVTRVSEVSNKIGFSTGDCFDADKVPREMRVPLPETTYTRTVTASEWSHEVEKNRLLLEAIFGRTCSPPAPKIHVNQPVLEWADRYLEGKVEGRVGGIAVLFPGAGQQYRSWPLERFARIAAWLQNTMDMVPIFAGSHYDRECLDTVRRLSSQIMKAALNIVEFAPDELDRFVALLSRSSLYVGNDTGPMHIAAALGIPTVGLFGGGTWGRFHPYGNKGVVVYHEMQCFQCRWYCLPGHFNCMKAIQQKTVQVAVEQAIDPGRVWQTGRPLFVRDQDHCDEGDTELLQPADRAAVHYLATLRKVKSFIGRSVRALAKRLC